VLIGNFSAATWLLENVDDAAAEFFGVDSLSSSQNDSDGNDGTNRANNNTL